MDLNQIPPNQQYVGWYDMPKEEFDKEFPPYDKDLKNRNKRKQSSRTTQEISTGLGPSENS